MSQPVKLLIGVVLLLIGGVLSAAAQDLPEAQAHTTRHIALAFGLAGLPVLALGLRKTLDPREAEFIRLKFSLVNVGTGFLVIAASLGVLYLFYNVLHVAPRLLVIGALVGVPVGLILMMSIYRRSCAACGHAIQEASRIIDDATANALAAQGQAATPGQSLDFAHCPQCRNFLILTLNNETRACRSPVADALLTVLLTVGGDA